MSKLVLRGGAAGLVLAALAATPAAAAPTAIRPQGLIDVSSDGRYVLISDGSVIDRSGTNALPQSITPPVDLADRAPIALDNNNGVLYVRTLAQPRGTVVSIGTDGIAVPAGHAVLVQNGTAVIFSTTESPTRIIKRDLTTGTSTVLLGGATLLDASENGKVITFERQVRAAVRPSGSKPLDGDPGSFNTGAAVGYLVQGELPRIVARSSFQERATGGVEVPAGTCPASVEVQRTTPTDLQISQDGSGGTRYSLVLTSTFRPYGGYPFDYTSIDRITPTGKASLGTSDGQVTQIQALADPVSGAWASILDDKSRGFPLANKAAIYTGSGISNVLGIPAPAGSTDTAARIPNAVPFNGGAGAAYTATPRAAGSTWTYVDEALPNVGGADATPWTTLPRSADAIDNSSLTVDGTWLECGAPVPAAPAVYAAITTTPTGVTPGSIAVHLAPAGKIAAKSVTATVSWYGMTVWKRTATADSTLVLPAIPAGVAGFKVGVKITLANGTVLSESAALRRTR